MLETGDRITYRAAVSWAKRAILLVMVALWLPSASHCLLEDIGWIHEDHATTDSDFGHDAADGNCHLPISDTSLQSLGLTEDILLWNPELLELDWCFELLPGASKPDFPGTAPPAEKIHRWQFIFRAALPVRAPSFAS